MSTRPWLALTPIRSTPEGITRAAMGFTRCSATWTAQTERSTGSSDRATPGRTPAQTRPRPIEFALQQLPEGCMEEEILVRYLPGREARHGAPATALSFGDHGLTSRREDTVLAARCKDPRSVEASGDAPCLEIVSASPHRACPRCEHHASSPGCCRPSCRYCSYAGVGARWIQVPARKGCAGVSLGAFRRRMPRRFMSSSAAVRGSYP